MSDKKESKSVTYKQMGLPVSSSQDEAKENDAYAAKLRILAWHPRFVWPENGNVGWENLRSYLLKIQLRCSVMHRLQNTNHNLDRSFLSKTGANVSELCYKRGVCCMNDSMALLRSKYQTLFQIPYRKSRNPGLSS